MKKTEIAPSKKNKYASMTIQDIRKETAAARIELKELKKIIKANADKLT